MEAFWQSLGDFEAGRVMENHGLLRYFDSATVTAVAQGKPPNFSVDKIVEIQDRLNELPRSDNALELEGILASSTKIRVRAHKLTQEIVKQLESLANDPTAVERLVEDSPTGAPSASLTRSSTPRATPTRSPPSTTTSPEREPYHQDAVLESAAFVQQPMQRFRLNPELPPNAALNVRAAPQADAEVVGQLSHQSGTVPVKGRAAANPDFLCVPGVSPGSPEAFVLSVTPDGTPLLVPVVEEGSRTPPNTPPVIHEQPLPQHQEQHVMPPRQIATPPLRPEPVSRPQPAAAQAAAPAAVVNTPTGILSGETVTRQEYNALERRVAMLEGELARLLATMRSV